MEGSEFDLQGEMGGDVLYKLKGRDPNSGDSTLTVGNLNLATAFDFYFRSNFLSL